MKITLDIPDDIVYLKIGVVLDNLLQYVRFDKILLADKLQDGKTYDFTDYTTENFKKLYLQTRKSVEHTNFEGFGDY